MAATIELKITAEGVLEVSGTDNAGNYQPIVDNRVTVAIDEVDYKFNPFGEPGVSKLVSYTDGLLTIDLEV